MNKVDDEGTTPLYLASLNGRAEVATQLIDAGADVDKADDTSPRCGSPARMADRGRHGPARRGSRQVDKANDDGESPLHIACQKGHAEVVTALLAANADVNQARMGDGATPLIMACHERPHRDRHEADRRERRREPGQQRRYTTPMAACQLGHAEVVAKLITANADVNQADDDGATPLHSPAQTATPRSPSRDAAR